MASASTSFFAKLVSAAGMSADQFGLEVARAADARAVLAARVRNYMFPPGAALKIPKISPFTSANAVTRATDTTPSDGDEGGTITYTNIDDTLVSMTKTFAYSAVMVPYTTQADLDPTRAQIFLNEIRTNMELAIAKKIDVALASLYSGLSQQVGTNGTDVSWANFVAAVELLEEANAPRPYYAVFHPKQYGKVFGIDEFVKSSVVADLGDSAPLRSGTNLRPLGVEILFSGNVQSSSGLHNLVFSSEAFGLARTMGMRVQEMEDIDTLSTKVATYQDFAVAEVHDTYAVDLLTQAT